MSWRGVEVYAISSSYKSQLGLSTTQCNSVVLSSDIVYRVSYSYTVYLGPPFAEGVSAWHEESSIDYFSTFRLRGICQLLMHSIHRIQRSILCVLARPAASSGNAATGGPSRRGPLKELTQEAPHPSGPNLHSTRGVSCW